MAFAAGKGLGAAQPPWAPWKRESCISGQGVSHLCDSRTLHTSVAKAALCPITLLGSLD